MAGSCSAHGWFIVASLSVHNWFLLGLVVVGSWLDSWLMAYGWLVSGWFHGWFDRKSKAAKSLRPNETEDRRRLKTEYRKPKIEG